MILVDTNLLLYAYDNSCKENKAARAWLDEILLGELRVGLPWPSLLGFVRIATNPRIFAEPASIDEAWGQVTSWLGCSAAWVPQTTDRHAAHLAACLNVITNCNDVPDAHLAALALEHGLAVYSVDSGFSRFPGLRWVNPLAKKEKL